MDLHVERVKTCIEIVRGAARRSEMPGTPESYKKLSKNLLKKVSATRLKFEDLEAKCGQDPAQIKEMKRVKVKQEEASQEFECDMNEDMMASFVDYEAKEDTD